MRGRAGVVKPDEMAAADGAMGAAPIAPPKRSLALTPISGEFADPAVEQAFLTVTWPSVRRHVATAALVTGSVFLLLGVADLLRHGPDAAFFRMLGVRLSVCLCALAAAALAARPVQSRWVGPAMAGLFWIALAGMVAIAEIRGAVSMPYIAGLMALVVSHYLFIPLRMTGTTLSAVLLGAVGLAYAAQRGTAPIIDVDGLAVILIAANLLGGSMICALNRIRRQDHALLVAEQRETAALRATVSRLEPELADAVATLERLEREAARPWALLDAIPGGMVAVDGHGMVVAWNSSFATMWAIDAAGLVRLPAAELRRRLQARLDSGVSADLLPPIDGDAMDLVLADGRVLEQTSRFLNLPGNVPGRAWFFRDVTELRRAFDAALEARAKAEAANRAKSTFLAMVSHEIRTPLNGILGMNRLLAESRLNTAQRAWVDAASHSGEVMLAVLDDLLDFNRMETAGLELADDPFDLHETVEAVARLFGHRAAEKGLRLSLEIAADVPRRLQGDANRLRQILMNLVGNAVKFTAAGTVDLRVSAGTPPVCGVRLQFEVIDTGIGISPATLDRVFDPFVQGEPAIGRLYGGTGLGLAICQRLVELQGGEIGAESRLGEGSRFWFNIAYAVAEEPDKVASEPRASRSRPIRILLADDNMVNQRLATTILEACGHKVTTVDDGAQAVAAARLGGFDVLVIDLRMPAIGGIEAATLIRSLPGPEGRVPIVALTANTNPDDWAACRAAGIDAVVTKPFTVEQLVSALDEAISTTTLR